MTVHLYHLSETYEEVCRRLLRKKTKFHFIFSHPLNVDHMVLTCDTLKEYERYQSGISYWGLLSLCENKTSMILSK
jgi:hypothetical protein